LSYVRHVNGAVNIGATTTLTQLRSSVGITILAGAVKNIGGWAVQNMGTVGGNLCGHGDLQGCLIALDATARSTGADGERTESLEDFLAQRHGRLLLDVSFRRPVASAFAALEYPHTHEYTVLAVTGVRDADGTTRLAATGVAGPGTRLRSAEALASDPAAAGTAAVGDVTLADDALASAWYRGQTLPVLVRRVLTQLEEPS